MAKKSYTKTMLNVGKYVSPDGEVDVTPERLNRWAENHQKLRAANYRVPMQWDHADQPEKAWPMSADNFKSNLSAENAVGQLADIQINEDGNSATIVMEVHDSAAQDKADNNTVFVSPVIFEDFTDGHGNHYEDVITHMDMVNYPVDHSQGDFEPVQNETGVVSCGIRMGLGFGDPASDDWELTKPSFFRLGKMTKKKKKDDDEFDEYDEEDEADDDMSDVDDDYSNDDFDDSDDFDEEDDFSSDGDYGDDDSADDVDDEIEEAEFDGDDSDEGFDEDDIAQEAMVAEQAAREQAAAAAKQSADQQQVAVQVIRDLQTAGIAPPEGVDPLTDPHGFLSQLCASLRQKKMDDVDSEMDGYGDMDSYSDDSEEEVKVKSPEYAQMSARIEKFEFEAKANLAARVRDNKAAIRLSLDNLFTKGRITPAELEEKCESLKTVRMSLDKAGKFNRTDLSTFIESRESIPEGTMWPADEKSQRLSAIDQPSDFMSDVKPEEASKYVDAQAERQPGLFAQ
jgi:hypothetical protein